MEVATYEVEGIEAEAGGVRRVFTRSSSKDEKQGFDVFKWKRTAPDAKDLETNAVQDALFKIGGLEASEFVDEPGPPEAYGLDKPALRLTLEYAEGKPSSWLEIGKKDGAAYGRRPDDAAVLKLDAEWGYAAAGDEIRERMRGMADVKAVLLTHNETSTAVMNPIAELAAAIREEAPDALILVDSVSGLGAVPFEMDAWGVDVVVTGSQKAWMSAPGLAMIAANLAFVSGPWLLSLVAAGRPSDSSGPRAASDRPRAVERSAATGRVAVVRAAYHRLPRDRPGRCRPWFAARTTGTLATFQSKLIRPRRVVGAADCGPQEPLVGVPGGGLLVDVDPQTRLVADGDVAGRIGRRR